MHYYIINIDFIIPNYIKNKLFQKIIVQRNEITNKCTLKLIDDQKFNSSLKLSEIEVINIFIYMNLIINTQYKIIY